MTVAPTSGLDPRRTGRPHRALPPRVLLTAIAIGAAACVLWPVVLAALGPVPLAWWPLLAHVCGLAAGFGVVVLIGLMSRTPALERGIGADRLARWHGRGGRAVVLLIVVHAVAAVLAWADSRSEGIALSIWHVLRMPWLISATLGTIALLVVAGLSIRAARRRISFETWHSVHLLVYLAVALGFVHQLGGPDLAGHRVLQVLWALLYTLVFALVAIHRVVTPMRNAARHRMRVVDVVPESATAVSIIVEGQHLHELAIESGQFFRWRFLTPDLWWTAHPFSLSAAPTPNHLRLTVKRLGQGSGRLQHLERGTWVIAEGSYGAVTARRRRRRDVLLLCAGVGVTPMRALFETLPIGPGADLLLLYRVHDAGEILFRAELEQLARTRGARLQYLTGGSFTPEMLRALVPNLPERDVYLCGPPAMARAARSSLREAGLPSDQLHEERFDL